MGDERAQTWCPICGGRVVANKAGKVRCGSCGNVFDAANADDESIDVFDPTIQNVRVRPAASSAELDAFSDAQTIAGPPRQANISGRRPPRAAAESSPSAAPDLSKPSQNPPAIRPRKSSARSTPARQPSGIAIPKPRVVAVDSAAPQAYQVGDVIDGRFEVFGHAAGGMGLVYFVRDRLWRTDLAIKSLRIREGAPAAFIEAGERAFLREALAWLDLRAHPHIVSGYFAARFGGQLRFFMEYVPGGSLRKRLQQQTRLPLQTALNYAAQIADGLTYVHAHTNGRPHRDLKPDNCLIDTRDDTVKITDFGLLKGEAPPDPSAVTGGKSTAESMLSFQLSLSGAHRAGTPPYMPPEQWVDAHSAGVAADVYAFGVMLFEMLVGRRPFEIDEWGMAHLADAQPAIRPMIEQGIARGLFDGTGDPAIFDLRLRFLELMHTTITPPDPREFLPDLPPAVASLIFGCLRKEPRQRPRDFPMISATLATVQRKLFGTPIATAPAQKSLQSLAGENNRALSLLEMGYPERAKTALDAVLQREPTALVPFGNRGIVELMLAATEPDASRSRTQISRIGREWLAEFVEHVEPARTAEIGERAEDVANWHRAFSKAADTGAVPENLDRLQVFLPMLSGTELATREQRRTRLLATARARLDAGDFVEAYQAVRAAQAQLPERKREAEILQLITDISHHGLICDVEDAWQQAKFSSHSSAITALATDPEGEWLVAGDRAGRLTLTQIDPPAPLDAVNLGSPIRALVAEPNRIIAALSGGDLVRVPITATDGGERKLGDPRRMARIKAKPRALAIGPRGQMVVTGEFPGALVFRHGKPDVRLAGQDALFAVAFTPDGEMVVGASRDAIVEWELKHATANAAPQRFPARAKLRAFGLTVDGKYAVTGGEDGVVNVFDYEEARHAGTLRGHSGAITAVLPTPEGRHIATAATDQTVRLWSLSSRQSLQELAAKDVRVLAAGPDGRYLFAGTADGQIIVWQIDWGWSFSNLDVTSRQSIAQNASFAYHRQQQIKRRAKAGVMATVGAVAVVVLFAIIGVVRYSMQMAATDAQWRELTARATADLTPSAAADLWADVQQFTAAHPEFSGRETLWEIPVEHLAQSHAEFRSIQSRLEAATTADAAELIHQIQHYKIQFADCEAEVAALTAHVPRLLEWQQLAKQRAQINEWPLAQRQFFGFLTEDAQRDRFIAAPPYVREWLIAQGLSRARVVLDWPAEIWRIGMAVEPADWAAFAELPTPVQTRVGEMPSERQAAWLKLPAAQIEMGLTFPDDLQAAFLARPPAARGLVAALPADKRALALQLSPEELVACTSLDAADCELAIELTPTTRRAFLALMPAERRQFRDLPPSMRDVLPAVSAPMWRVFIELPRTEQTALASLPAENWNAVLALPAAERAVALDSHGTELVEFLALEPAERTVCASLPAAYRSRFVGLLARDRRSCAELPASQRLVFIDLPSAWKDAFLALPPDLRAVVADGPAERRAVLLMFSPATLKKFLAMPRAEQDFCAGLPAEMRAAFVDREPAERAALATLTAAEIREIADWEPAERETWMQLPPDRRATFASMQPAQRRVIARQAIGNRVAAMALDAEQWAALQRGMPVLVDAGAVPGSAAAIATAAFFPMGDMLVTGSDDRTMRIWNLAAGSPALVATSPRHPDGVVNVAVAPDGRALLSGCASAVRWWRFDDGGRLNSNATIANIARAPQHALAFSSDGQFAIVDARLLRMTGSRPEVVAALLDRETAITAAAFSVDGRWVMAGTSDGTARVWEFGANGLQSAPREVVLDGVPTALAIAADNRFAVVARFDAVAKSAAVGLAMMGGQGPGTFHFAADHGAEAITGIAISPDGRWVIAASGAGTKTYCVHDGELFAIDLPLPASRAAAFAPDGRLLAIGGQLFRFFRPSDSATPPHARPPVAPHNFDAEVFREFRVAGHTYSVTRSITIAEGETVAVPAGSRLTFAAGATLTVRGTFSAVGAQGNRVIFDGDSWGGIRVVGERAEIELVEANVVGAVNEYGGGLSLREGAAATISHATFQNCDATKHGGAIHTHGTAAQPCRLEVRHSTFSGNHAAEQGGAIDANWYTRATFDHCMFDNNHTEKLGGAVISVGKPDNRNVLAFSHCEFTQNRADRGGAININFFSAATIDGGQFTQNSAPGMGGAVLVQGHADGQSEIRISGASIVQNTSNFGAGVAAYGFCTCTLAGGKLAQNVATSRGGGLYAQCDPPRTCTVKITGTTFSENVAAFEGSDAYFFKNVTVDPAELTAAGLTGSRIGIAK